MTSNGSSKIPRILSLFLGFSVLAASFAMSTSCQAEVAQEPAYAISRLGPVVGNKTPDYDEFLGIRYAKPPVGSLRWQPPQPSDAPIGKAVAFGPHCAQNASPFGQPS